DDDGVTTINAELFSRREKQIRIGFRMCYEIARDDRNVFLDPQKTKRQTRTPEMTTRRNGPRYFLLRQIRQQLRRARQRPYLRRITLESIAMRLLQSLSFLLRNRVPGLTQQGIDEETATHSDLPVNT